MDFLYLVLEIDSRLYLSMKTFVTDWIHLHRGKKPIFMRIFMKTEDMVHPGNGKRWWTGGWLCWQGGGGEGEIWGEGSGGVSWPGVTTPTGPRSHAPSGVQRGWLHLIFYTLGNLCYTFQTKTRRFREDATCILCICTMLNRVISSGGIHHSVAAYFIIRLSCCRPNPIGKICGFHKDIIQIF